MGEAEAEAEAPKKKKEIKKVLLFVELGCAPLCSGPPSFSLFLNASSIQLWLVESWRFVAVVAVVEPLKLEVKLCQT